MLIDFSSQVPKSDTTVTTKVFMDISIDGQNAGNVVFGLFGATTPITVKNFVTLATGSEGYGYEGSIFHRVVKGFVVQGKIQMRVLKWWLNC